MTTSIKNYWQQPPSKQRRQLANINKREAKVALEREAEEKRMLIVNGALVKPEDYPCACSYEEASDCYDERHEREDATLTRKEKKDDYCWCPCHTYAEGW